LFLIHFLLQPERKEGTTKVCGPKINVRDGQNVIVTLNRLTETSHAKFSTTSQKNITVYTVKHTLSFIDGVVLGHTRITGSPERDKTQ
jgi:hypothetical protein